MKPLVIQDPAGCEDRSDLLGGTSRHISWGNTGAVPTNGRPIRLALSNTTIDAADAAENGLLSTTLLRTVRCHLGEIFPKDRTYERIQIGHYGKCMKYPDMHVSKWEPSM